MADQIQVSPLTLDQYRLAFIGDPVANLKALAASIGGSISFGEPATDPEAIVKSFVDQFKDRRDQRLEQIRNPPGVEETATLCWGKAPPLQQSTTNPQDFNTGFNTRKADDEPASSDDPPEFVFSETDRKVKKIKVASEQDKSVYVVVERIEKWYASGSNGARYRFDFKNK